MKNEGAYFKKKSLIQFLDISIPMQIFSPYLDQNDLLILKKFKSQMKPKQFMNRRIFTHPFESSPVLLTSS